ncbi:MAG: TIGR03016 family PEP-CTERM system-associated outer membrane protein [Rhodospirillaceae bacterium]
MGFLSQLLMAAAVRSPRTISGVLAAGVAAIPSAGQAAEWTIIPRATVSSVFTDNANEARDREDRNSDLLVEASPGVAISGTGGRFSLALNYSHSRFHSFLGASDESATNSLIANGRMELYDRVAFVDATSSISRQVIDSSEPVSSVDTGSSQNRTTVQTASLQPFFLHHFGTWLETESRTTLNVTRSQSDEVSDTRTIGESFTFNSGRRFSVFTFSGALTDEKTMRDGDEPSTSQTVAVTNYRLRVMPKLSLLSSIGWEKIDDPGLNESVNGMTWNVGFAAQPNSRSSIELTYGREQDAQSIDFSANYALSRRTNISASYSESLTSSARLLNEDLDFVIDNGSGVLIDSRTGQPFDPSAQNFDFQTSLFRQRVFTVSLAATRRLVNYAANVSWERRETDTTGTEESVTTADISASRPFNSRLSGTVGTSISFRDFGTEDAREDRVAAFTASLSYLLAQNTFAALSYSWNKTQSTEGANNFHDNTVTLSLTRTF